ncbi:hypothetical protein [Vagococcus fessus]|uniref:Uncharacterized protein n=1 Tax=Vagococcus fessus TaxID=120370 RepID=A0A430ABL4_9ENTE|nr:hypothetical protein [Vagococcus fessus]RSU04629.1 hypothetical protein CBF31_01015 [Vagococcus fessus]
MKTFKEALLNELDEAMIPNVAAHLVEMYETELEEDSLRHALVSFKNSIASLSDQPNDEFKILIEKEIEPITKIEYWSPTLVKVATEEQFSTDLVPFEVVFNYMMAEELPKDASLLGDIIWEITFDGWTKEEQLERIKNYRG